MNRPEKYILFINWCLDLFGKNKRKDKKKENIFDRLAFTIEDFKKISRSNYLTPAILPTTTAKMYIKSMSRGSYEYKIYMQYKFEDYEKLYPTKKNKSEKQGKQ